MTPELRRRIGFSAYTLGTIRLEELADFLEVSNLNDLAVQFNDWLKAMPPFVLGKWDGVHYDDIGV